MIYGHGVPGYGVSEYLMVTVGEPRGCHVLRFTVMRSPVNGVRIVADAVAVGGVEVVVPVAAVDVSVMLMSLTPMRVPFFTPVTVTVSL